MIIQYHRPQTLEEALILLEQPETRPLGGGTVLIQKSDEPFSVVDLQALGLDKLNESNNTLEIGATAKLQAMVVSPFTSNAMKTATKLESPLNLRNLGTVAGTLVTCDGRSPFGTVMLALDAKCWLANIYETITISLGDLLTMRNEFLRGKIITKIEIPLKTKFAFETVARTPADKPIVCAALAQWPSGRTRLTIGGWGQAPKLAMDGNEPGGLQEAARNATSDASDEWASAEYRMATAAILVKRCQDELLLS
jgi:CO/xanthine dehydrogenase FAD-binding subunit